MRISLPALESLLVPSGKKEKLFHKQRRCAVYGEEENESGLGIDFCHENFSFHSSSMGSFH